MQISSDWEVVWGTKGPGQTEAGRGCLQPPRHLPGDRLDEMGAQGGRQSEDPLSSRAGNF